jgi:hypothetical protein
MAVRADGTEIYLWIEDVLGTYFSEGPQVMHMYVACSNVTILSSKVERTYPAPWPPVTDAASASSRVSLIDIDCDRPLGSLYNSLRGVQLLRKKFWMCSRVIAE